MTTTKSRLEYILAIVTCLGIVSIKNFFFSTFWPPLSEMNILSSFVLVVLSREKHWEFALLTILTAGILLDVLSFSPFGINLLLVSCLTVLGFLWIELFEKDLRVLGVFLVVVPLFDWFFIHFVSVLTNSVRPPSIELALVLLLSIPINVLLFVLYHSLLPLKESNHVE